MKYTQRHLNDSTAHGSTLLCTEHAQRYNVSPSLIIAVIEHVQMNISLLIISTFKMADMAMARLAQQVQLGHSPAAAAAVAGVPRPRGLARWALGHNWRLEGRIHRVDPKFVS